MAKFWFVSAPLLGHLDWGGFFKTAQTLQAQGHAVTWVSQSPIRSFIEEKGLNFAPVPETGWLWPPPPPPDFTQMPPWEAILLRYTRALDTWLSTDLVGEGVTALLTLADTIGPPDVLVTDPFLSASALAAEKMDVPMAVCGWPASPALQADNLYAVQKELAEESRQRLNTLFQRFGLRGENFSDGTTPSVQSPHLHISYFSRYWYQAERDFLPQNHFVGGMAHPPVTPPPAWFAQLSPDQPLALITLGSVFTGDLGFFAWAAQAAHRSGLHPLVVIGHKRLVPEDKDRLIKALPPRAFLLNWVDFDHVLPRVRVMVHHGGMGTTHAGLVHAVPQVIVPHAADQQGQATRASQAKIGLKLTAHDVQRGQLLPAIRAISTDAKVKQTCIRMAEELAKLGGPPRAAELLTELVN